MVKRRSFLGYFSVGWLVSCFPVVLAACTPNKSESQATAKTEGPVAADKDKTKPVAKKTADGYIAIGSVAQLEKAGYLQTKQVAVSRDPANPKQLIAVNPKCTHQGCDVKWVPGEKRYECPCHDSDFAADGKVLKGPATAPLATYPVKIVGTQVLVKV
ncbi:ubiquinol-cytochrome c reductase iron-sulfur subunit [Chamaesiphon sp. GL140_3_metabinner_50]|uniref:QcrA and Rieske domain-containing protein n=1 Tax=Chamaesiphon sp. GL140_3_metabinner_50 TaxID=2970812 RepID=UPI0025D586E5|nr:Rieske 2Fe-2S domain-containing protein [Chamaesiphon sp. GL140_3_metabinner_50]